MQLMIKPIPNLKLDIRVPLRQLLEELLGRGEGREFIGCAVVEEERHCVAGWVGKEVFATGDHGVVALEGTGAVD